MGTLGQVFFFVGGVDVCKESGRREGGESGRVFIRKTTLDLRGDDLHIALSLPSSYTIPTYRYPTVYTDHYSSSKQDPAIPVHPTSAANLVPPYRYLHATEPSLGAANESQFPNWTILCTSRPLGTPSQPILSFNASFRQLTCQAKTRYDCVAPIPGQTKSAP